MGENHTYHTPVQQDIRTIKNRQLPVFFQIFRYSSNSVRESRSYFFKCCVNLIDTKNM